MTQSFIIYRNPMEQAFWESGLLVPIGASMIAGFIMFLVAYKLGEFAVRKIAPSRVYSLGDEISWFASIIAILSAIVAYQHVAI